MELQPTDDTLDLRDYLAVVRRQATLIGITVALVVTAAMAGTVVQTPVFESTVEVVVEPLGSADERSALEQALLGQTELETQRKLATSVPVAERVIAELELDTSAEELLKRVRVDLVSETQILDITVEHTDPERAAQVAQGFADAYLTDRRQEGLGRVLEATRALEERARTLRERIDELAKQIDAAESAHAEAPPDAGATQAQPDAGDNADARAAGDTSDPGDAGDIAATPDGGDTAASDLDVLQSERDSLLTQLGQVTAQATALESTDEFVRGGGRIIVPATVPEEPSSPKPLRNGVLAVVLGVMLGVAFAFLRDHLDDAIRSDEDAARASGRPVIGRIPHAPDAQRAGRLISVLDPWSPAAEAYRTLRSNVRFIAAGGRADREAAGRRRGTSLAITSAAAVEGKTTTAANLAVQAARTGTRVLLVDADLRRPNAHSTFGVDPAPGLSDLLVGTVELRDVIVDVGVPNLRLMPAGNLPPNPAELLASPVMAGLRRQLEELAELVIYDTPPVLTVADALEVAPAAAHTLLVVDARGSGRRTVRAAVERLGAVGASVDGCVLNNLDVGDTYYGYYDDGVRRTLQPEPVPHRGAESPERGTRSRRADVRQPAEPVHTEQPSRGPSDVGAPAVAPARAQEPGHQPSDAGASDVEAALAPTGDGGSQPAIGPPPVDSPLFAGNGHARRPASDPVPSERDDTP
ncbi:MAG TPA: polysaccharide biosynthesis tyrosine autokinase [Nitriliruptorales bacterium]|nr:polysaccharide biosynthesis tyrosine autokinase [Nitriliruptorales bacterium]